MSPLIHKTTLTVFGILTAFSATAACAQTDKTATLTITDLTQVTLSVPAGQETFFTGTLTNNDTTPTMLGGLNIGFDLGDPASLDYETGQYDNTVNGLITLAPSAHYSGTLFGIIPGRLTPPGSYGATLQIADGAGSGAIMGSADFQINVAASSPAPEPSAWITLGLGTSSVAGLVLHRRSAKDRGASCLKT